MIRFFRFRLFTLGGLGIFILTVFVTPYFSEGQLASLGNSSSEGLLTVAFLDVGQGDAIFVETPDGVQLLIDGGPDAGVLREVSKVMPFWDRKIDVVLATHPDKDHIGGLVDILGRYQVSEIIRTENESDTAVSSAFAFMESDEGARTYLAKAGDVISLGASTTLMILSPSSDTSNWESNTSSIVVQLKYGDIEFMLTGDAPLGIEEYLVKTYGETLESEVLKLGHHGSKTSTADSFLEMVAPAYAVVSAGKDNRYGHPHQEVIDRVKNFGSTIMNTATDGNIIFKSDGTEVWLED
ncbi:MAG: ComEC/Rec2 family competence protein [Candidatus Paceibacterota bacterium]